MRGSVPPFRELVSRKKKKKNLIGKMKDVSGGLLITRFPRVGQWVGQGAGGRFEKGLRVLDRAMYQKNDEKQDKSNRGSMGGTEKKEKNEKKSFKVKTESR